MKYIITVKYEGDGKADITIGGDFRAIMNVIHLMMDSALLDEIAVEKVKGE